VAAELGNMRVWADRRHHDVGISRCNISLAAPRRSVLMVPLLCVVYTCVGAWLVGAVAARRPRCFIARAKQYAFRGTFHGRDQSRVFGSSRHFPAKGTSLPAAHGASGWPRHAVVQSAVAILIANYILAALLTQD
jgi:hypothetical protein